MAAEPVGVKGLYALGSKQLLDQEMIKDHCQKAARGKQRIDRTKHTFTDPLLDVFNQMLVIFRDEIPVKAVRELMILEGTEEQQPRHRRVAKVALQAVFRNGDADLHRTHVG